MLFRARPHADLRSCTIPCGGPFSSHHADHLYSIYSCASGLLKSKVEVLGSCMHKFGCPELLFVSRCFHIMSFAIWMSAWRFLAGVISSVSVASANAAQSHPQSPQHEDSACECMQVRGTLLTASQCATYDDTKRLWMRTTGWRDGLGTHVGVSMITGVPLPTCVTSLVD